MDKHDVTLHILEHDGGSFAVSRGYGIPDYWETTFKTGYMVAIKGAERKIRMTRFTADSVASYVEKHADILRGVGYFLGAWVSDGYVYLDISCHWNDRKTAERVGRANGQLAIWGIRRGQEITL